MPFRRPGFVGRHCKQCVSEGGASNGFSGVDKPKWIRFPDGLSALEPETKAT